MSLTSILTDPFHQPLRDAFKETFPHPRCKLIGQLKAPPLTTSYGVVGTAFDYLFRFTLEHWNKRKFKSEGWVAGMAHFMLCARLKKRVAKRKAVVTHLGEALDPKALLDEVQKQFKQAKANYQKYKKDGQLTDQLLANTLFLAKLDLYIRAGMIDEKLVSHSASDVADLRALLALVDRAQFSAREHCVANPTFGQGSLMVGGADADLIIDGTLIDLKVTRHLRLERAHFNQVIGYYMLSLINKHLPFESRLPPIHSIGIYFARHGVLWKARLCELADEQTWLSFAKTFESYVCENATEYSSRYAENKAGFDDLGLRWRELTLSDL